MPKGSSKSRSSSRVGASASALACRLGVDELDAILLDEAGVTGWRARLVERGVARLPACETLRLGVDAGSGAGRWPTAALVSDDDGCAAAVAAELWDGRDLVSTRGASRRPLRFVPAQGEPPFALSSRLALPSWADSTDRCLDSRLAWSRRRLASDVSGPTTGRSISRMAAPFLDLAMSLRRLYSARCRCVVKRCAVCSSSSSTMR